MMVMNYNDPAKLSQWPISFGTLVTDTFLNTFTTAGFAFKGHGTIHISGDGYGTLLLPGRSFTNTLRVKMIQEEEDTLIQFGTVSHFSKTTYKWFDPDIRSALLEIDSMDVAGMPIKTIKYLRDAPFTTGLNQFNRPENILVFPNPSTTELTIRNPEAGELMLSDPLGNILLLLPVSGGETQITTSNLPPGMYQLRFTSKRSQYIQKLIIHRP